MWKSSKKVEKVAEEIGYPGFGKNVLKSSKKVEKVAEEIGYPGFDKNVLKSSKKVVLAKKLQES